jgi:hypothetical protein
MAGQASPIDSWVKLKVEVHRWQRRYHKVGENVSCPREVLTLPYMATRAISQLILSVSSHTIISMLTCRCSRCYPSQKYETIATIKKHLRKDLELVDNSHIREHSAEFLAHLQECIDNNTRYLQSLGEWN